MKIIKEALMGFFFSSSAELPNFFVKFYFKSLDAMRREFAVQKYLK
jgi:hypothetical protein